MTTTIFHPMNIKTNIQIFPQELTKNISDVVFNKLKTKYEGKCSNYGYIRNNSIKVIKRSCGEFIKEHFNSALSFKVVFSCEICNPLNNDVFNCKVVAINNMGIKANYIDKDDVILDILIPKITAGIVSEIDLDTINEGDNIDIMICGKRFNLNDTKIEIIGRAIKNITDVKNNTDIIFKDDEDEDDEQEQENEEYEEYNDEDDEDESVKKDIDNSDDESLSNLDNDIDVNEFDLDGDIDNDVDFEDS